MKNCPLKRGDLSWEGNLVVQLRGEQNTESIKNIDWRLELTDIS
jgi:hypothetical protein